MSLAKIFFLGCEVVTDKWTIPAQTSDPRSMLGWIDQFVICGVLRLKDIEYRVLPLSKHLNCEVDLKRKLSSTA